MFYGYWNGQNTPVESGIEKKKDTIKVRRCPSCSLDTCTYIGLQDIECMNKECKYYKDQLSEPDIVLTKEDRYFFDDFNFNPAP